MGTPQTSWAPQWRPPHALAPKDHSCSMHPAGSPSHALGDRVQDHRVSSLQI